MRGFQVAAAAALLGAAATAAQVQTKDTQAATTPVKALALLKEGNARFVAGTPAARDLRAQVKATAAGQYPFAAILGCMDSRASAELVLDQGIGDVFSIRVAGNVVDTDDLGSLEYAAKVAGAKLIVVMGHTSCGAIKGAVDDVKMGNLTYLLEKIRPAIDASGPRGTSKDHAYVDRVAETKRPARDEGDSREEPDPARVVRRRKGRPRGRDVRRRNGSGRLLRRLRSRRIGPGVGFPPS